MAVAKNLTNDEMVKKMQEQVISMQDKQMSFLNDTIGNTNDSITIFLTALGIISAVVIGVITYVHGQAKKRMDEAEVKMNEATQKITHAESLINTANETIERLEQYRDEVNTYRTETEQRVQELSLMIDEKMINLKEIENSTNNLVISYKVRECLLYLGKTLRYIEKEIDFLIAVNWSERGKPVPDYQHLKERYEHVNREYKLYHSNMEQISLNDIKGFYESCLNLYKDATTILREVQNISLEEEEDENEGGR
ncbi:hypothetical protein V7179_11580 [Priestia megaterium]